MAKTKKATTLATWAEVACANCRVINFVGFDPEDPASVMVCFVCKEKSLLDFLQEPDHDEDPTPGFSGKVDSPTAPWVRSPLRVSE